MSRSAASAWVKWARLAAEEEKLRKAKRPRLDLLKALGGDPGHPDDTYLALTDEGKLQNAHLLMLLEPEAWPEVLGWLNGLYLAGPELSAPVAEPYPCHCGKPQEADRLHCRCGWPKHVCMVDPRTQGLTWKDTAPVAVTNHP